MVKIEEEKTREIKIIIPEELFTYFTPRKMFQHFLNAKKEFLLSMRDLIDTKIEILEKREKKRTQRKVSTKYKKTEK